MGERYDMRYTAAVRIIMCNKNSSKYYYSWRWSYLEMV